MDEQHYTRVPVPSFDPVSIGFFGAIECIFVGTGVLPSGERFSLLMLPAPPWRIRRGLCVDEDMVQWIEKSTKGQRCASDTTLTLSRKRIDWTVQVAVNYNWSSVNCVLRRKVLKKEVLFPNW